MRCSPSFLIAPQQRLKTVVDSVKRATVSEIVPKHKRITRTYKGMALLRGDVSISGENSSAEYLRLSKIRKKDNAHV